MPKARDGKEDLRNPPEGGGGGPTLIDFASASTAWTKDPEANPAATRPRTARRLVSGSAGTCCWALTVSPGRVMATTRLLPFTFKRVEPLSRRLPSNTAWDEPRKPAIEAIAWAIFSNSFCSGVLGFSFSVQLDFQANECGINILFFPSVCLQFLWCTVCFGKSPYLPFPTWISWIWPQPTIAWNVLFDHSCLRAFGSGSSLGC